MKFTPFIVSLLLASGAFGQDPAPRKKQPAKEVAKEAAESAFEIKSMKCFGEKSAQKSGVGKGGIELETGNPDGAGPELADFTFPEDQRKQHFEFQFGPGSEGKTITARVLSMRTTLGANLEVVEVSGKTDGKGRLPAAWNIKKNWPVGLYKVFFTCDGKPVGNAGYLVKAVKERKSPFEATGVTILSHKDGENTEKTELTTSDRDLTFKCSTTGANTGGVTVSMYVQRKKDAGGATTVKGSEVKVEDWPLEDTEIIYSFEMPDKIPVGDYEMVVLIDDEVLTTHPFSVKE